MALTNTVNKMLVVIVYVVVLVATLVWYNETVLKKKLNYVKNIPGPPRLPLIGNAHQLIGTTFDYLTAIHQKQLEYGKRYLFVLGPFISVSLTDPKDAEVILSSNEILDKAPEYKYLHPWLGLGLLTSTGEKWRRRRKFLTPSFHFNILRNFVPIFDRRTDSFVHKLAEHAHGDPVDIYPLITRCTLDQLSESAMGTSTEEQTEENVKYVAAVKELSQIVIDRMKNLLMRIDFTFWFSKKYTTYTKALQVVKDYTTSMIEKRKRVLKERNVDLSSYTKADDDFGSKKSFAFLDLLLLSKMDGMKLDDTAIQNEVDTFMFEGHDTTASGISFTIYLLAHNPEVQEKLYHEQMSIFESDPHRPTTYSDLQEMKYMDLAIKESLRIYPSVPFVGRHLNRDTKINDLLLPAGSSVMINIFTMSRDPEIFDNPLEFRPERFTAEEVSKRHPYSNVSFSAGPRNCIGQKFAMYEIKMTLSKLIRNYHLEPADMPPLQLSGDLVLKSSNGIHVRIKKRI